MTTRPEDESRILRFSWEEMDRLQREVARQIRASRFVPDAIVAIMRCGLVPAAHLSYILGVRKLVSIAVRTMNTDAPLETNRVQAEMTAFMPEGYLKSVRVLLVDAVMESGTTVDLCLQELRRLGASEVAVAIIVDWYNSSYRIASGVRPRIHFTGTRADRWPDFPWES